MRATHRPYSMESIYKMIGKSRQQYHQTIKKINKQQLYEKNLIARVQQWRRVHPKMGSRSLFYSLIESGVEINYGVNKFEQFMAQRNLTVGKASKYGPKTSDGKGKRAYPNLTDGLIINDTNQLIVGDITYFWLNQRWYYIFTLKDLYSQYILSLQASSSIESVHAIEALLECEATRGTLVLKNCIHHTDNGSQYESSVYKAHLNRLKMQISRAENCHQNGSAEQLNHIVKNMYLKHWAINSFNQLQEACRELLYINNHQRAVKQLDYLTPVAFEKSIKHIPPDQRKPKILYDFS